MATKRVSVDLEYHGSGHVESQGNVHRGGTVAPILDDHLAIQVRQSYRDDNGIFNPAPDADPYAGGLPIVIDGDRDGYGSAPISLR